MDAIAEKNNKLKALTGTLVFHGLLLLLFILVVFKNPDPPMFSDTAGVEVNFGLSEDGMGDVQPEPADAAAAKAAAVLEQERIKEQETAKDEKLLTQEVEEAEAIASSDKPKKEKKPEKKITPTPVLKEIKKEEKKAVAEVKVEKKEPTVNTNAMYKGKSKSGNEGETNKPGDQGIQDGSLYVKNHGNANGTGNHGNGDGNDGLGGKGGNGTTYNLAGRKLFQAPKISDNSQETGRVVVDITVDKYGTVTNANPGGRGSTTSSANLYRKAKEAALRAKFSPSPEGVEEQRGTITFVFFGAMTWKETLSYLYSALPMFQRIGPAAYKPNLDNTIAMSKLLGNPEKYFKTIHIAGTNGKGSTSHMLAAIFQEAGYKTGLYTSPHLKDFRERIRINGKMISKRAVIDFTLKHKQEFELLKPSFFEMTVGLAFDYFRKQKVDIAIIETGLGGRLDSTNIITPELSIITNISFDHTNLLGNTLGKIAFEKAGIIKPGIPVIIGETHKETKQVFLDKASAEKSPIYFADNILKTSNEKINRAGMLQLNVSKSGKILFEKMQLDLAGLYQAKNIKAVLLAAMMLKEKGFRINEKIIRNALKKVTASTGLKGRWQTISHHPLTICDTGHNEDGIRQVLKQINQLKPERLLMVFGMVNDKEVDKILKMLPRKAGYFFCQASIPRAMDAMLLAEKAKAFHLNGIVVPDVKKALKTAQNRAGKNDLVFVGGSTFVVAEVC